jgi:hypothetical protein
LFWGAALFVGSVWPAARPLQAQGVGDQAVGGLPARVAADLVDFYNTGAAVRLTGASLIAEGSEVAGGVAVLGGPLTVAGRIDGRVVVINGDVILEPGAVITGDLTVVGGSVRGLESVPVGGTVIIYRAPLRFRRAGDRIAVAAPEAEPELVRGREFDFGRTDLVVAARRGYNRVEGLPIVIGPRFESHRDHPTRVELLAIYRTASGLSLQPKRFGYLVQVEQAVVGRSVWLGASLRSEIEPIEQVGLADRENSLATFLLHRDFRDHYERRGWGARVRVAPVGRSVDFALGYHDEGHAPVRPRDPRTLFRGGDDWRPQPVIASGQLRFLTLEGELDTRNEGPDPTTGWFVRGWIERGLGGTATVPKPDLPPPAQEIVGPLAIPAAVDADYALGTLDLRRYARLSPSSGLALRALASSSLNDRPLPPQRQRVLGGAGSLPGYAPFKFDCGARGATAHYDGAPFYPYYGCDRVALIQLEYRNDFPFGRGWGRKLGSDLDLGERLGWVVFFDAGRAWVEREAAQGRGTGENYFAADLGFGVRIGRLGLYWAVPLSGRDRDLHFSLRLGPRF